MKTKTETFESALKKLEETVEKLEEGTIPLNDALKTFESGVYWSKECKKFLDEAELALETEKDIAFPCPPLSSCNILM